MREIGLQQPAPGLERKQVGDGPARKKVEQQPVARGSAEFPARRAAQRRRHARLQAVIGNIAQRRHRRRRGERVVQPRRCRTPDATRRSLPSATDRRRAPRYCAKSPAALTAAATTAAACPAQAARSGSLRGSDRPFASVSDSGRDRSRRTEICMFAAPVELTGHGASLGQPRRPRSSTGFAIVSASLSQESNWLPCFASNWPHRGTCGRTDCLDAMQRLPETRHSPSSA